MKFCRNAPDAAKRMLSEIATQVGDVEHFRIIDALASDDRMEEIWETVAGWPDAQISILTRSAYFYAMPCILADLVQPPEKRVGLGQASYELFFWAKHFADALERHRVQADELWPQPVEDLLPKLREFSKQLYDRWFAVWSSLEQIPAPNLRGPGDRREIAYGNAIVGTLEHIGGLTRERQDELIAALTNVVFFHAEGNEVQAETIRVRRRRKSRAIRAGEGDKSDA
ncbi:MAG TPA: hypothetical protein VGP86_07445 [Xanthobacteraceae bacterium]|jgi:hypothetical protein|nr:hypothetical protein [Xanthobacteraceae bacterium]